MRAIPTALPEVLILEPLSSGTTAFLPRKLEREDVQRSDRDRDGVRAKTTTRSPHSTFCAHPLSGHAAQGKLVRAVSGTILDVAVDLRRSSRGSDSGGRSSCPPRTTGSYGYRRVRSRIPCQSAIADVLYKTTEYWIKEYDARSAGTIRRSECSGRCRRGRNCRTRMLPHDP